MNHEDDKNPGQDATLEVKGTGDPHFDPTVSEGKEAQKKEESSTGSSESMTPYERRSVGIQWLIFGVTAIYAFFAALQWDATRDSAEISEQTLELSQRPWVSVDVSLIDSLTFVEENGVPKGGQLRVMVKMKNVGNSVALRVFYNVRVTYAEATSNPNDMLRFSRVIAVRNQMCEKLKAIPVEEENAGVVLFPDEPWSMGVRMEISQEEIQKGVQAVAPMWEGAWMPALVVCVDYQPAGLREHYQTRRVYVFGQDDAHGIATPEGIIPKGSYDALKLIPALRGTDAY